MKTKLQSFIHKRSAELRSCTYIKRLQIHNLTNNLKVGKQSIPASSAIRKQDTTQEQSISDRK